MNKERRIFLIVILSIILFWVITFYVISENQHKCVDNTHITCDGPKGCECDGLQCP